MQIENACSERATLVFVLNKSAKTNHKN